MPPLSVDLDGGMRAPCMRGCAALEHHLVDGVLTPHSPQCRPSPPARSSAWTMGRTCSTSSLTRCAPPVVAVLTAAVTANAPQPFVPCPHGVNPPASIPTTPPCRRAACTFASRPRGTRRGTSTAALTAPRAACSQVRNTCRRFEGGEPPPHTFAPCLTSTSLLILSPLRRAAAELKKQFLERFGDLSLTCPPNGLNSKASNLLAALANECVEGGRSGASDGHTHVAAAAAEADGVTAAGTCSHSSSLGCPTLLPTHDRLLPLIIDAGSTT